MFKLIPTTVLFFSLMTQFGSSDALADITGAGNGGDICEANVSTVAEDLKKWLLLDGANGLEGLEGTAQFTMKMVDAIENATVLCTDKKLLIEGAEKTCINRYPQGSKPTIVCNRDLIAKTSVDDLYLLTHHEYAGLAGYEVNTGAKSDYRISKQIPRFLGNGIHRTLTLRKQNAFGPVINGCGDEKFMKFSLWDLPEGYRFQIEILRNESLAQIQKFIGYKFESAEVMRFQIDPANCEIDKQSPALSCWGENANLQFVADNGQGTLYQSRFVRINTIDLGRDRVGLGLSVEQRPSSRSDSGRDTEAIRISPTLQWGICASKSAI